MNSSKQRWTALGIVIIVLLLSSLFIVRREHSKSTQNNLLNQQQSQFNKTATSNPILKYLPYGNIGYNITPTFEKIKGTRTLVLIISITLSDADYKSSPEQIQQAINQREQAALDYIRSLGFDPHKYTIQYSVPAH